MGLNWVLFGSWQSTHLRSNNALSFRFFLCVDYFTLSLSRRTNNTARTFRHFWFSFWDSAVSWYRRVTDLMRPPSLGATKIPAGPYHWLISKSTGRVQKLRPRVTYEGRTSRPARSWRKLRRFFDDSFDFSHPKKNKRFIGNLQMLQRWCGVFPWSRHSSKSSTEFFFFRLNGRCNGHVSAAQEMFGLGVIQSTQMDVASFARNNCRSRSAPFRYRNGFNCSMCEQIRLKSKVPKFAYFNFIFNWRPCF